MLMPGRFGSAGEQYRFGFNGKEFDPEVAGNGNQYDYGFRIYNTRIGRFLSVDPLANEYVSWSPYNYVMGNPILLIDPDGRSPWQPETTEEGNIRLVKEKGDNLETPKTYLQGIDLTDEDIEKLYDNALAEVWVTLPQDNYSEAFQYAASNKEQFAESTTSESQ